MSTSTETNNRQPERAMGDLAEGEVRQPASGGGSPAGSEGAKRSTDRRGMEALVPIVFFLVTYLGGSFLLGDFYRIPMTVAFMVSSALAIGISKGSLNKRLTRFSQGAGDRNIILMVWIYVMAGAFAASAKGLGAVDATVSLILHIMPQSMIYVGLFVAAAFVSLAIGTSVGTVVALVPIAAGVAEQLGVSTAEMTALVVGGAYLGDNLSFISDTTIAATQTQGVKMKDKFQMNIRMIWPAFAIMLIYCIIRGLNSAAEPDLGAVHFENVLPYAAVIGFSIFGVNVLVVLGIGIVITCLLGMLNGGLPFWDFMKQMGDGVSSMGDLIVVAMLAGGMLELIRANGGLRLIINTFSKRIRGKRGAEAAIASLVAVANLCTANNTVSIITVGRIAQDVAKRYGVDPRRAASLLDTTSCFVQGLLPYGVQMLLAAKLANCSPMDIVPHLYYPMLLGLCVAVSIVMQHRRVRLLR